jgi:hypothetical protein
LYIFSFYIEIIEVVIFHRKENLLAKFYLKYNFEYNLIFDILNRENIKRINFFFDLQSICTGFYNRDVVLMEVGRYVSDGKISDMLLDEFHEYLINLYNRFKQYDPYFCTFFDDGACKQNRDLQTGYKGKNSLDNLQVEVENIQLFRSIKKYYFQKIYERYNMKPEISRTFYLKEYEADCVPYYCVSKNLFDSQDPDVANFIFSKDKDLLQTCQFGNTYQIVSGFKPSKGKESRYSKCFNNIDCIEYIYDKFKRGILTAKHVPLILAISGDKSDMVDGISGIGPAKAVEMIQNYNLPPDLADLQVHKDLPEKLRENLKLVISNLKLTDFKEQIKRIPIERFN